MKLRPLARLRRALAWMRSLHAKLFLVTALLTSFLTVMVALTIVRNNRREFMTVGKNLAIQTAQAVSTEILQRDPAWKTPAPSRPSWPAWPAGTAPSSRSTSSSGWGRTSCSSSAPPWRTPRT